MTEDNNFSDSPHCILKFLLVITFLS